MRRLLILFTVLISAVTCKKEKDNFEKYEWTSHYFTYDKDYNKQEKTKTLFRNDSVVSFSELQNKEIAFPIIKLDSAIIIKKQVTISDENDKKTRDTLIIDTLLFDFKNILNKPVLILKKADSKNFIVLTCENCKSILNTTSNFLKKVTIFKIGGITIGDTISKERLINIKDSDGYGEKGFVEANLADNENIKLKLINRNIVYSIEQEMIEEESIENIIEVINSKTDVPIDTIKEDFLFYTEGYRWTSAELDIELSKDNMSQYYLDQVDKEKNNSMKSVLLQMALESRHKDKYWKLEYDNKLLQTVLKYHQDSKKVSTIIE